jgi:hypothetical protein
LSSKELIHGGESGDTDNRASRPAFGNAGKMLAKQLIASLDEDEPPFLNDAAIAVAQRRANELADGTVEGIPADEVSRELEQEFP